MLVSILLRQMKKKRIFFTCFSFRDFSSFSNNFTYTWISVREAYHLRRVYCVYLFGCICVLFSNFHVWIRIDDFTYWTLNKRIVILSHNLFTHQQNRTEQNRTAEQASISFFGIQHSVLRSISFQSFRWLFVSVRKM